ncbi:hypothetical protein E3O23_00245 [Cryobacterium tagatosivorans]|uniref:Uncharacterized protein n=1 Tax=Cryobacterium tagatosivorans TaxID=1259199 RepID=A0A4R8UKB6_9MICO|nr:hypothetical protein E3O23_00245 [Cryobacterium tagatosivorans]
MEYGVHGISGDGRAVFGEGSGEGDGVAGTSQSGTGVFGEGARHGVHGKSGAGSAVYGEQTADGDGVTGLSQNGTGVFGEGEQNGVHGKSGQGRAVFGENTADGDGVAGFSDSGTGVAAISATGTALYARSTSGRAGYFQGHLEVTGEIRMLGADCAEEFTAPEGVAAGSVMVIDDEGGLALSSGPYDKRVAGVVAGAGSYRPALVLDGAGEAGPGRERRPISLMGKAYCLVDARETPVSVGDLLTTGEAPGCAMRASDRDRAFGAVLGKALAPLSHGTGLIPILVALQ